MSKLTISQQAQFERSSRIAELRSVISSCISQKRIIDKEKLIAEACLKYNVARRTALEYIKILMVSLDLKEEKGLIAPKKKEKQEVIS